MSERKKIECFGLKKNLGGKQILNGLDLNIIEGETFVLIGQSGVGKSVLLKHIIGLMKPDEGELYIDGMNMAEASSDQWDEVRKEFGMLFQGGALFDSFTVGQNLLFALDHIRKDLNEDEKEEKILGSLNVVGLPGIEDVMPSELSGGMMKRVALARAIVTEPDVILFDEPTTGLDPIMTANINQLIVSVKEELKTTFVVVTHDINSAKYIADRIGLIYRGKVVFTGNATDVENSDNEYIRQFVEGKVEGPITNQFIEDLEKLNTRIKSTDSES